jgi:hypothetical protein
VNSAWEATLEQIKAKKKKSKAGIAQSSIASFWSKLGKPLRAIIKPIDALLEDLMRRKDPETDTYGFFGQFYFLFKRAFTQNYRDISAILLEYTMHFSVGAIVSLGLGASFTLGSLPDEVCVTQAVVLMDLCMNVFSTFQ